MIVAHARCSGELSVERLASVVTPLRRHGSISVYRDQHGNGPDYQSRYVSYPHELLRRIYPWPWRSSRGYAGTDQTCRLRMAAIRCAVAFRGNEKLSGAVYRHVAVNGSLYGRRRLKPSAFDRGIVISGHVQELAVIAVQADDTSRFRPFSRIRLTRPGRFPQPLS